jgi:hypothetical protein
LHEVEALETVDSDVSLDLEDVGMSKKQRRRKGAKQQVVPRPAAESSIPASEGQVEGESEQAEAAVKPDLPLSKGKRSKAAKQSGTKVEPTQQAAAVVSNCEFYEPCQIKIMHFIISGHKSHLC